MSSNLSPSERLGYLVKRAQHSLRTSMDEALSPVAITTPQYNVLCAVEVEPGISNAALARSAFVTAQSMQGIVANLERLGLISRVQGPDHGRILRSELTLRGLEVLTQAHALVKVVEVRLVQGMEAEEIKLLIHLLQCCTENLTASTPR
jgi:DNA-binding MarR family transcriptional regulator